MGAAERANPFNQWKRMTAPNTHDAYDRFGRLLSPDDVVFLIHKRDAMWRVLKVRPLLDPQAPPGTVELTLTTSLITGVPGGTPLADVIKVVDAEETKQFMEHLPEDEGGEGR